MPIIYWNHKNKPNGYNSTCARFPNIFDLEFNNIYWQTLKTKNGIFQLFGAYLDRRISNPKGPSVRILGMIDRIEPKMIIYCQFWFNNKQQPIISKTSDYNYIWHKKWGNYKNGIYQPYLITCKIPYDERNNVPSSISLVTNPCDTATNNLRVVYLSSQQQHKKDFAVCVKGLDYLHKDHSIRLIEWIELIMILGADKIFFYKLQLSPNMNKVLNYYINKNKIDVTPLTLPGNQPNIPKVQHIYLTRKINIKRQNEIIPYNDCFYKHMYQYKYIAVLDIDEIIMPLKTRSWKALIDSINYKGKKIKKTFNPQSYNVRNVYFLDSINHNHGWINDVPKYMHMLQHVYRTKNFTKPGQYIKCFHNTEKVLTIHNHFPLSCLPFGGKCTTYSISTNDAQLQHYRADCVRSLKKSCKKLKGRIVKDISIWRFNRTLVRRTYNTMKALGFI